jgi:hypothetical protein
MSNKGAQTAIELRQKQIDIVEAFRAKHGVEPEDVVVDIRRLPGNRLVWSVRKASKSERDAREQQRTRAEVQAMESTSNKPHVFASTADGWWARLFSVPKCVYLTERGARDAGGKPVKVEVRA